MSKKDGKVFILVICAFAVIINVVLGQAVSALKIPLLFLDTMGTIFIAALFGMRYGILTGVCTNLLMGVIGSFTAIPFALVNVAVAVVVSLVAKAGTNRSFGLVKALIAGVLLAVVCPMIGAPIRIFLFGGLTGSGTDILIMALRKAGQNMVTSAYWGAVTGNLVDKIVSCILVSLILSKLLVNSHFKNILEKAGGKR